MALWTLFILGNSLRDAAESEAQSTQIVELLRPLLEGVHIPEQHWSHVVRKAAHFTEFAILGALFTWLFRGRRVLIPLLCCLGIAAADETIQMFIPGRSGEFRDLLIDMAGALTAILVLLAELAFWGKRLRAKWQEES